MSDDVDEALEETFPASDPPANTPETGIGVNGDHDAAAADTDKPESGGDQYSTNTSSGKQ